MADTKISELASATALADSDVLCGVNSGRTRKFSLLRIRDFFAKTLMDLCGKTYAQQALQRSV